MLNKIRGLVHEAGNFHGKDKLVFLASLALGAPRILRDKTILTMKLARPIPVKCFDGKKRQVSSFYEVPFYTYDYTSITRHIENNSAVFDIGAHFGEVSYRFLAEMRGFCYLFEPNPHNRKIIDELFSKEKIGKAKDYAIIPFALGSKEETLPLYLSNPLSYEGSLDNKSGKKVNIKVKRFDGLKLSAGKYKNAFFKIDVEGHEVEVVEGMQATLKKMKQGGKRVKLLIEIKDKARLNKIKAMLDKSLGRVKVTKIGQEDYLFAS